MGKSIGFITLGCKLNYAETSTYERALLKDGFVAVPWNKGADAFLVNTCTVTEHSDKKCRNIIRKLHRQNPDSPIFVTGCYAQLKKAEIEAIDGVKCVFGANEKSLVVPTIKDILNDCESCAYTAGTFFPAYSSGERTRSFLKVQDGCDYKCHYCTVPYARGESRNISIAEIVSQAKEIAAEGIIEVVLTGVNTGDFGRSTGENFFDLIKALNEVEGIERYRISSIEPNLITDEIIELCARSEKFMPHFHIPLQSGSTRILGAMRRRYTAEKYRERIARIREFMPDSFLGVDVIVGFPGEGEEEFMETYRLLEEVEASYLHIFPFSERPGTPAITLPNKVMPRIATERVARLEELSRHLHRNFAERFIGQQRNVLFESTDRNGLMYGYTDNYLRVAAPYDISKINTIVPVILDTLTEEGDISSKIVG